MNMLLQYELDMWFLGGRRMGKILQFKVTYLSVKLTRVDL